MCGLWMELPPTHQIGPGLLLKEFCRFLASNYWPPIKPRFESPGLAVWGFLGRETTAPHPNVDSLKPPSLLPGPTCLTTSSKGLCCFLLPC
ncbi:Hypothetical protein FKW44_024846 [Caligus rogercresseyi]|uniref:Uncharacterized protein n=1 Tax=Caligus rogercresseyi TaxID=217165 RepID=A0A7T8GM94_CALRO|nr:Hypothetical protein FKW44_024846 [Caligus rogercresseyi]